MNCAVAIQTISRYLYDMIKSQNTFRFLLTALVLVAVASISFAVAEEGDKDKDKNGKRDPKKSSVSAIDSNSTDDKYDIQPTKNQVDDTLVYEDWDGQGGGGGDDDGQYSGAYQGNPDIGGSKNKPSSGYQIGASDAIAVFKKTYRVEFDLYPNPVADELHIRPEKTPQTLQITNLVGKVQKQGDYTPVVIVSDLASGVYHIQLIYPDRHVESRKFIKY